MTEHVNSNSSRLRDAALLLSAVALSVAACAYAVDARYSTVNIGGGSAALVIDHWSDKACVLTTRSMCYRID